MGFGTAAFGEALFGDDGEVIVTGQVQLPLSLTVVARSGPVRLPLSLTVYSAGPVQLPLSLTVVSRSGPVQLPLSLSVFAAGPVQLPLSLSVLDAAAFAGSAIAWRPVVRLAGVDVSARLTGLVEVEAEESAARIARFALAPLPGVVPVTAWVGKAVEIDFALMAADGSALNPVRLFTGVVDVPDYDMTARVTTFVCTDLLQESLDRATRGAIDALAGGRWSVAVSGAAATNWDYAQARLASVPAALDLDAWRGPRVTPWAAKAVPDFVLDEGDLLDGKATVRFANRSQIRNARTASFQYRFPRLQSRGVVRGYTYPFDLGAVVSDGYDIPTREMVRQALDGTGWEVAGEINFTPVPGVPAGYVLGEASNWQGKILTPLFGIPVVTTDGKTAFWSVTQDVADQLCFGYVARLTKRWAQSVEEQYTLRVSAPASIAQLGEIDDTASAAMEDAFDTAAWEAGPPKASGENVVRATAPAPVPALPDPGVGHVYQDGGGDTAADRAAADNAIGTMVAQARVAILGSHRLHAVAATLPIAPSMDLPHTVRITTAQVAAKGKLRRVRHTMDVEAGEALTDIELALSRVEAVGVQTDDPVTVPAPPPVVPVDASLAMQAVIATWVGKSVETPSAVPSNATGFFTNLYNTGNPSYLASAAQYPVQLIVEAPAVPAEDRDNKTVAIDQAYRVAIPEDELVLTA